MKQLFLSGKGEISVQEAPLPGRLPGSVLVRNRYSLISSGTEAAAVSRRGGWWGVLEKAWRSGDKLRKVWDLARRQGMRAAWQAVRSKLDDFTPVGYSSCGQVVETDEATSDFRPGDWVACMGTGFANHAEHIVVPSNLAAKLPEGVAPDEASFAALACIAMQGIRNLELTPGETVAVIGLGLIGSLAAVLARAMGYTVCGIDLSSQRAARCQSDFGITAWNLDNDVRAAVKRLTGGQSADGVILTAATKSSEPVNLAFDLCRARGAVSVVGDVGLELDRAKMYRKEIGLRVSCSYGPGRYDHGYELDGRDYPLALARWTERRNLQCFLGMLADRRIDIRPLISRTFSIDEGAAAFALLKKADADVYGVLFDYGEAPAAPKPVARSAYVLQTHVPTQLIGSDRVRIGLIGCGGFAKGVHVPNLLRLKQQFSIAGVASRSGASAAVVARRFGIPVATSDHQVLLDDSDIDAVLISTRHASHARLTLEALDAGKHVFVDKPLCLSVEDGVQIEAAAREKGLVVRVGFNRRFAPQLVGMREALDGNGPRLFTCRVSVAGEHADHWSNAPEEGGRFLGEGVHFLDLCNWFAGSAPQSIAAQFLGPPSATNPNALVSVSYPDGSAANVIYTTSGHTGIGKEHFEAHGCGRSARCQDFRKLELFGSAARTTSRGRGDKGHLASLNEFYSSVRGIKPHGIGADARAGTLATWMALAALQSAKECRPIEWLPSTTEATLQRAA